MEAMTEEIDIGIGVQEHLLGWTCPNCGEGLSVCASCGVPEGTDCRPWCAFNGKTVQEVSDPFT